MVILSLMLYLRVLGVLIKLIIMYVKFFLKKIYILFFFFLKYYQLFHNRVFFEPSLLGPVQLTRFYILAPVCIVFRTYFWKIGSLDLRIVVLQ